MNDHKKTKAQLIAELQQLRQKTSQATSAGQPQTAVTDWATIILDNIPYLAWIKDTEGVFLAANKHFVEASGFAASELLGKTDFEVWPLDLAEKYVSDDLEILQSGQSKLLEEPIDDHYSRRWFETFKTPVRDENGSIIGVVGLAHDITSRKGKEEDLRNSAEFFDAVINAIADPLFVKDEKHRLIVVNEAMSSFMGLRAEDIIGKSDDEIFPEEEVQVFWEQDNKVFASDQPLENEEYFTDAEGVQHTISTKKVAHRLPNGQKVLTGTIRDITERKRAESVLAKRAAELETVVEVSAKISTILNSDQLLQEVVDLTKERFNLYHVHIYLVDDKKDSLRLMAGAGDVGRKMVEQGWQLDIDHRKSLVAQTAQTRQGVIANDVCNNPYFLPNPLLPHTKSELVVPIIYGDDLLGVLDVQADQVAAFTDDDVQIQTILATQIAIALQNSRLFAQTQQALAETEALYAGSDRIIRARNMDEILNTLFEATPLQQYQRANIVFFDRAWQNEQPQFFTVAAAKEKGSVTPYVGSGTQYPLSHLPGIQIVSRKAPAICRDVETDPRIGDQAKALTFDRYKIRSTAIFPLITSGQWVGLVTAQSDVPTSCNDQELRQISNMIEQASVVIQNQRLFDQTQTALTETELLYDMSAELNASHTLDEIVQTVVSTSVVTGANQADLFIIEVDQTGRPEWMVLRAAWRHEGNLWLSPGTRLFVPDSPGASLWMDAAEELVMIENVPTDSRLTPQIRHFYQHIEGQATVIMPLRLGNTWVGLMRINWPAPKEFNDRDKRFYKSLAAQTAVLLNNKLLLENSQRRAEREQLVNAIGQKIQQATSTERAMQTAIKELGHALQTARIQVNLTTGD